MNQKKIINKDKLELFTEELPKSINKTCIIPKALGQYFSKCNTYN